LHTSLPINKLDCAFVTECGTAKKRDLVTSVPELSLA
jgi:hypothetical protein